MRLGCLAETDTAVFQILHQVLMHVKLGWWELEVNRPNTGRDQPARTCRLCACRAVEDDLPYMYLWAEWVRGRRTNMTGAPHLTLPAFPQRSGAIWRPMLEVSEALPYGALTVPYSTVLRCAYHPPAAGRRGGKVGPGRGGTATFCRIARPCEFEL